MRPLAGLIVILVLFGIGSAAVLRVPSQHSSIYSGLNAAQAGDTVLVAPGTYRERIVWPGRDSISLVSEAGPEVTILRPKDDSGRVLLIPYPNITSATLVRGFTITGGRLVSLITAPGYGAGIRIVYAGPEICHNRIVGNRVFVPGGIGVVGNADGAGVSIYTTDNAPLIHDNLIAENTIVHDETQAGFARGAGVSCNGPGVFYQNEFRNNSSYTTGIVPIPAVSAYGGGLCIENGPAVVFSNLFLNNRAGGYDVAGAHAYGGGLYLNAPSACVANNTFVGNVVQQAISWGGAICVRDSFSPVVKNNIMAGNIATGVYGYGGAVCFRGDTLQGFPVYDHNNTWDNTPDNYFACRPGPHRLYTDPRFAVGPGGNFYLSATHAGQQYDSPCIDAGDTLLMTSSLNLDSLRRTWTTSTDSAYDRFAPDMGYLYPLERVMGIEERRTSDIRVPGFKVEPNPVTQGCAFIRVQGVEGPKARVRVFDATGRCVEHAVVGIRHSGQSVPLDLRRFSAGVYVLELEGESMRRVSKLVIQR